MLSRKQELLEIEADEPEMLHATLSKLPKPLDLEGLIQRTIELRTRHPPQRLPGRVWSRISSSSVLKTTQDPEALLKQTLEDGERYFLREAAEIRRREAVKARVKQAQALYRRYRRPTLFMGSAVLFAILGVLITRSDGTAGSTITILRQRAFGMWQHYMYK